MVMQQYLKNIGKQMSVTTQTNETLTGELVEASKKEISLRELKVEKNKTTKKKVQIENIHHLLMDEIRETKLIISF